MKIKEIGGMEKCGYSEHFNREEIENEKRSKRVQRWR